MKMRASRKTKQLSKGILEMKFMKKSKEKFENEEKEEEGRGIFKHDLIQVKQEGQEFILEPSLVPIDRLMSGRMSFRGMNPEVERLMKKEKQHILERLKEEERIRSNKPDIPDEDMAACLGRKIKQKFSSKRISMHNSESSDGEDSERDAPIKKAKFIKPVDSD